MPYTPVPVERFGGLKLDLDPGESAQYAIDGQDFDLTPVGQLRSRKGFTTWLDPVSPSWALARYGVHTVVFGDDTYARAIGDDGTVTTNVLTALAPVANLALFSTPTSQVVIVPQGNDSGSLVTWNGTAFTEVSGYGGRFIAVQSGENRVVLANTVIDSNGGDAVRFSKPGLLEWNANDYVLLSPGSGQITGMVAWGNSIFVFKKDRFFEFYGNTTDAVGNAVFNYRAQNGGVGAIQPEPRAQAVCAGRDGVYFLARDGVYRTTGGPAVKISSDLDPLFVGGTLSDLEWATMSYRRDRLYLSTDQGTWVWLEQGAWLPWSWTARGFWLTADDDFLFSNASSDLVSRLSDGVDTDAGAAITASYQSGWGDFGYAQEKTIRETILWGTGSPSVRIGRDYSTLDTAEAITLGTAHAQEGRRRTAIRGTEFSYELSGSAPWVVNRLVHNVRGVRSAGVETAA